MASLAPDVFHSLNIRRVTRRLAQQIHTRFARTYRFTGEPPTLRTHHATDHERRVVHDALALCTPWDAPPLMPSVPRSSQLTTHFGVASRCSDWDRIHALIDPARGGLAGLIRDYHAGLPRARAGALEDPDESLAIPDLHPSLSPPLASHVSADGHPPHLTNSDDEPGNVDEGWSGLPRLTTAWPRPSITARPHVCRETSPLTPWPGPARRCPARRRA
jgi:hypothetical protein